MISGLYSSETCCFPFCSTISESRGTFRNRVCPGIPLPHHGQGVTSSDIQEFDDIAVFLIRDAVAAGKGFAESVKGVLV